MHCTSIQFNIDDIYYRETIEKRESEIIRFQNATIASPTTYVTTRDGYGESLNQEPNLMISDNSKESKPLRNTRNSNLGALKRKDAVRIGYADNRSPSPKRFIYPSQKSPDISANYSRSQFVVSKEEEHLPYVFMEFYLCWNKTNSIRPLVWPPSGKKRVTVDPSDLERLEEGEFLNDNIINFYLRYYGGVLWHSFTLTRWS